MTMVVRFRYGALVDGERRRCHRSGKVAKKSAVAGAKVGEWNECLIPTGETTETSVVNGKLPCCIVSRVGVTYFLRERGAVVICACWLQMFDDEEVVGVRAHDRPENGRGA